MEISVAKKIMGNNFIGPDELAKIQSSFPVLIPDDIPEIEFSEQELAECRDTHVLILCVELFADGKPINIIEIKNIIEKDERVCFYNQDWYLKERFVKKELSKKWCLISKNILGQSRGMVPDNSSRLFKAIELTYTFFVYFFVSEGNILWKNDYVWCSDIDDKGDQIYVGRYVDASGLNADGFEIHRHLKIKLNYGIV